MTAAGPVPRSWAAATTPAQTKVSDSEHEGPAWRATALSLFFAQGDSDYDDLVSTTAETRSPHPHQCPSLAECCLRVLLEHCVSDVAALEELASFLAPHHRKEAMRVCAVQSPLSGARLRALLGEGRNNVEGELVVVQPASPLRPEIFRTHAHTSVDHQHQHQHRHESESEEPWQWDDAGSDWQEQELDQEQQPLTTVAIVSTALSIHVLLALPSSLTRLALVHLSAPITG